MATPARLIRLTPAEAMRVGTRMGAEAARAGADAQDTVAVVCGRLFWRAQSPQIRQAFAWAFAVAYCAAEELE